MSKLKTRENVVKIELFALFVCLGNESICSGKRGKLSFQLIKIVIEIRYSSTTNFKEGAGLQTCEHVDELSEGEQVGLGHEVLPLFIVGEPLDLAAEPLDRFALKKKHLSVKE